ncbi:hypothetical protein [Sphingomonas sp. R1]|uniref:hypothetical protein n=1 Tax=Sphingomonas sp. R1 TaxID=399176 RepID=UPI0022250C05|nr:hypothetical protein [Sphingomonas sp. R1]UYY79017.1 hypothetical protein OIM94_08570 [Sphingomonas sp. R1]
MLRASAGLALFSCVSCTSESKSADTQAVRTEPFQPRFRLPVEKGLIARWSANQSTIDAPGGRVRSISDLSQRQCTASDEGSGLGPQLVRYANGMQALRFNQDAFLSANTPPLDPLASTIIIVLRDHSTRATNKTIVSSGKRSTTGGAKLAFLSNAVAGEAPFVGRAGGSPDPMVRPHLLLGCQLQVAGWRNGALGDPRAGRDQGIGQRCGVNRKAATVANRRGAVVAGLEIGRDSAAVTPPSTPTAPQIGSGSWYSGDILDVIVYDRALKDAEFDAVMAAAADAYRIPEVTDQFVLEGDSRICGIPPTSTCDNPGMMLTEPGAPHALPPSVRMINYAVGGSSTVALRARLNLTPATAGLCQRIPGGINRLAFMCGHNDLSRPEIRPLADRSQAVYRDLVQVISGHGQPSYISLGWEVTLLVEMHDNIEPFINGGSGYTSYRALQRSLAGNDLLNDTQTGPGQQYANMLHILDIPRIRRAGRTVFDTRADTANPLFYRPDRLHETPEGMMVLVTGGDTPQFGLRSVWRG